MATIEMPLGKALNPQLLHWSCSVANGRGLYGCIRLQCMCNPIWSSVLLKEQSVTNMFLESTYRFESCIFLSPFSWLKLIRMYHRPISDVAACVSNQLSKAKGITDRGVGEVESFNTWGAEQQFSNGIQCRVPLFKKSDFTGTASAWIDGINLSLLGH